MAFLVCWLKLGKQSAFCTAALADRESSILTAQHLPKYRARCNRLYIILIKINMTTYRKLHQIIRNAVFTFCVATSHSPRAGAEEECVIMWSRDQLREVLYSCFLVARPLVWCHFICDWGSRLAGSLMLPADSRATPALHKTCPCNLHTHCFPNEMLDALDATDW